MFNEDEELDERDLLESIARLQDTCVEVEDLLDDAISAYENGEYDGILRTLYAMKDEFSKLWGC